MATMLHNAVVVFHRSVHTHAIQVDHEKAMLTMKKELHGYLFLCTHVVLFLSIVMVLHLAAGAPLLIHWLT